MSCHFVINFAKGNHIPFDKIRQVFSREVQTGVLKVDTGTGGNAFFRYQNPMAVIPEEDSRKIRELGGEVISGPFPRNG
ncbi:MAG: hypothetical protein R3D88_06140 [Alphaproteobacteria bacterium]